jgi:nucleotide-binding universal stress UspA family protein
MADEQIEQIAFYWISIHGGDPAPLTVRILSRHRDLYFDLAGGNRIPKIGERQARTVAELREAGVGVRNILLAHYNTSASSDLFAAALTMLDPEVPLTVAPLRKSENRPGETDWLEHDLQRAKQLKRDVEIVAASEGEPAKQLVALIRKLDCDLLIVGEEETPSGEPAILDYKALARSSPCPVCLVTLPVIPHETEE